MADTILIHEGKTKKIWLHQDSSGLVTIQSKNDITAGDGERRDEIDGKAAIATATTANVFEYLKRQGIPTHFRGQVGPAAFDALNVDMIPLELVARRVATGSYLKRRPDVVEGTTFDPIMIEFFEKDDAHHDPLVIFDFASGRLLRYLAGLPLGEGFMNEEPLSGTKFADISPHRFQELVGITRAVFLALEEAWSNLDVTLVDIKIECGIAVGSGRLVVADVVDNDSWRIWPGGKKSEMKDKQVYRDLQDTDDPAALAKSLGKIKDNYAWVADQTGLFLTGRPR